MGFFSKFTNSLKGNVQKLNGRSDALEAVCAACAYVAAADGDISDAEVATTITTIQNNATLAGAFTTQQIEKCADVMFNRAKGGRSGRLGLKKEIMDIANDNEIAEIVFVAALDVADHGDIDEKEKKVLLDIAGMLGVDAKKYDLAA